MTRTGTFFSFIALALSALGSIQAIAKEPAAAGSKDGAAPEGPLLVARLPAKPETKTYDLQYKLSRGDVLRYEVTHQASISGTAEKSTQTAQSKTDSIKVWKVTDVLPSGDIEVMNVCERVRMMNVLPEGKATEYDSTRDKTAPPGFEDAAKAIGVPLSTMRITTHGKVLSRQVKVHNQGSNDDAAIVLRLPDKPVAIGDTWDEPFEVKVNLPKGASKSVKTRWHHKLADVKDDIATIDVTYQILSPADAGVELELVQRMQNGQVKFDIGKGRIQSQKMDVDKRIIGFAGPTSSMQYIMKMEEKLLNDEPKTAAKAPATTKSKAPVVNNRRPNRPTQTASKPQGPVQGKSYRR
jgi:hypothetical protein